MRNVISLVAALYIVATTSSTMPAQAGTTQRSLETIIAAIRQNPNDLNLRREVASAMIIKGQTVKAAEQLHILINSGSATSADWTNFGEALRYSADFSGAVRAYTYALKLNPVATQALAGLALAHAGAGQYNEAISLCRTGLSQTSDVKSRQYLSATIASVHNMTASAQSSTAPAAQ